GGVGMLLEKLFTAGVYSKSGTVLQFHEWITGAGLLYCKMRNLNVPTVFTIHATVLGRTLSSAGVDVYTDSIKAKQPISLNVAYNNRVEGKHQLELAAAKEATVFTAVSETVAQEAAYILGKKPDVVTFNGIDYSKAKWKDKMDKEKHDLSQYARNELLQFIEACFTSYYVQRYDDALLIYISGRYEFTNKGFDIFMKGVGKLNDRLKKKKNNKKRVFAFIFAPSSVKGPKISIIKNYLLLDKINEILQNLPETKGKPYVNLQTAMSMLSGEKKKDIENMAKGFVKDGPVPHINCYDLAYTGDAIIKACVDVGLDNQEDDVVKVVFYPTYSKPNDGLMNLNYYDVISAMDIGIFPSRYEPFGYTPVEAATEMSMAIASDMSGFGKFMLKVAKGKNTGVTVLHMAGKSADAAADELADRLEQVYFMPQSKIDAEKTSAYKMMALLDWNVLIKNYYQAYELALAGKAGKKKEKK
ncbi:MAG: glycogen/starch synthase, partial [Candidatus Micrarchaeota archaeon]|nr:glycogen/starch synthase [Candidatus Micrarchaeota archaeon]